MNYLISNIYDDTFKVVTSVISVDDKVTLTSVMDKARELIASDSRDILNSASSTETLLMRVIPSIDSPDELVELPEIAVVKNAFT